MDTLPSKCLYVELVVTQTYTRTHPLYRGVFPRYLLTVNRRPETRHGRLNRTCSREGGWQGREVCIYTLVPFTVPFRLALRFFTPYHGLIIHFLFLL